MRKTVAEYRADTMRHRAEHRESEEAQKTNPHLEALVKLIEDVESDKTDMSLRGVLQRLKGITYEMMESPLVLKVDPSLVKVVNTECFKACNAIASDGLKLEKENFIDKARDILGLTNHHLYLLTTEDEDVQEYKDWVLDKVASSQMWLLEWMDEQEALALLGPEGAALACLAGNGFRMFHETLKAAKGKDNGKKQA